MNFEKIKTEIENGYETILNAIDQHSFAVKKGWVYSIKDEVEELQSISDRATVTVIQDFITIEFGSDIIDGFEAVAYFDGNKWESEFTPQLKKIGKFDYQKLQMERSIQRDLMMLNDEFNTLYDREDFGPNVSELTYTLFSAITDKLNNISAKAETKLKVLDLEFLRRN